MDKNLLKIYKEYAATEESRAVIFIKEHMIESEGHWIDIESCWRYFNSRNVLEFKEVKGAFYKRKIKPKYPPKSKFTSKGYFDRDRYYLAVRAITWQAAREDINNQKQRKIQGLYFRVTGVSRNLNKGNNNYFLDDAQPGIKALANNLNDKTNPLWDIAYKYEVRPKFVYKIKSIQVGRNRYTLSEYKKRRAIQSQSN